MLESYETYHRRMRKLSAKRVMWFILLAIVAPMLTIIFVNSGV